MGRDKMPSDSGSLENWKAFILLTETLIYVQLKLPQTAMVAFGDLPAEVLHAAAGSLSFLSYSETGIVIFYSISPQ